MFVAGWYTARMLSKEEFGQLQFVTFIAGLSWTLLSFGVPNMLSRYMTQSVVAESHIAVLRLLSYAIWAFVVSVVALCISMVLFMGSKNLSIPVGLIIVFVISQFLANYFQILIQSVYRYRTAFTVTAIAAVSGGLLLYITLPIWHSLAYLYSLLLVNIILVTGYATSFFKAVKKMPRSEGEYKLPHRNTLFRMALYFAVSAILAGILWQRTEFYLLEKWLSFSDIAVYSVAFTLIALFFEPLKLLTGVLPYYYAGIRQQDDRGEQQFISYFKHFCWLVIFIGTFAWFNAHAIVHLVYTDKYADAAIYLRLLLIGMVPGVCSYVLMNMHIGMGRSRFLLIQDLVCAVIFCVAVFYLTQWKGLQGTAIAKSFTVLISVSMGMVYTARRIRFSIPWKLPVLSLSLSIALGFVSALVPDTSVLQLLMKLILVFTAYVLISYFSHMLDRAVVFRVKEEVLKLLRVRQR